MKFKKLNEDIIIIPSTGTSQTVPNIIDGLVDIPAPNTIASDTTTVSADNGIANALRDLIKSKTEYVNQLHQFITDLDTYSPNNSVKQIITDMISDDNNEIGQLQSVLNLFDNLSTEIQEGQDIIDSKNINMYTDLGDDDLGDTELNDYLTFVSNADMSKLGGVF